MDAHEIPFRFADLNYTEHLSTQGCHALWLRLVLVLLLNPGLVVPRQYNVPFLLAPHLYKVECCIKVVRRLRAAIISSGLETTIIRPTMIYGTPGDRNIIRLVQWLDRWPVLPVFGNGRSLQQPVHVSDVAWAIVQALESSVTIGRAFNISGADPLTYNDVIRVISQALGRRVQCFHIPVSPIVTALQISESFGLTLPIKAEQVLRLNEDKVFSHMEAADAFGYTPMSFDQGIRREVELFRSARFGLAM